MVSNPANQDWCTGSSVSNRETPPFAEYQRKERAGFIIQQLGPGRAAGPSSPKKRKTIPSMIGGPGRRSPPRGTINMRSGGSKKGHKNKRISLSARSQTLPLHFYDITFPWF